MRRLFAPCFALTLAALPPGRPRGPQVWEEGHTVLTILDSDDPLAFLGHGRQAFLALGRQGQPPRELRMPGALRYPRPSHWKGRSFAFSFPDHPAWSISTLSKQAPRIPTDAFNDAYRRAEHHLFQSTDFRTWHLLARYRPKEDQHGETRELLPLEDGSFLAFGRFDFWEGNRVSPVARYRVDERGHLIYACLVKLGAGGIYHPVLAGQNAPKVRPGYEGIEPRDWLTARTPEGLVLFQRGGWFFVLDNADGHCLREGRFLAPDGKYLRVLDAEPDREGQILVASTHLRWKDRIFPSSSARSNDNPSERLASRLMVLKGENRRVVNDLEGSTPVVWHRLDPATGHLSQVPPPHGVPTQLKNQESRWTFGFTIRPDGNLDVTRPRNERRWLGF